MTMMQSTLTRRLPTILFFGAPGTGKGTQARLLRERLGLVHIDFGHERRLAVAKQSLPAAIRMKQLGDLVSRGQFLDDDVVCDVFREVISNEKCGATNASGIVLDGFPRNLAQAKWMMHERFGSDSDGTLFGLEISAAVLLHAPFQMILRRTEGRLIHGQSGRTYHPTENPPLVPMKDDLTGDALVSRPLSTKLSTVDALKTRMALDDKETGPLINYLEELGKVIHIDIDRDERWFHENRRHPTQLNQKISNELYHFGWLRPQSRRNFSSTTIHATATSRANDLDDEAPVRHVAIVGLGPHAQRIYFPYLCNQSPSSKATKAVSVPLVIDMEDQRGIVDETIRASPEPWKTDVVCVAESDRHLRRVPDHVLSKLEMLRKAGKLDGMIVSSEPSSHEPYVRYALEHGVHLLVDKPPTVPVPFRSGKMTMDFDEILALAAQSSSRTCCMVQRRAHPGYKFVRGYLSTFIEEFGLPLSYLDLYHADGMWCMPGELAERENHPYKYGYGKLIHSGYHFLDLLTWLGTVNSVHGMAAASSTDADAGWNVIQAHAFDAEAYGKQMEGFNLKRLSGASAAEIMESDRVFRRVKKERTLGEINVHALLRSNSCVASVNLLQYSFSRRGWFQPARDVYKGNGRVRHERLVANVGPLLSIHIHSYQSYEVGKHLRDQAPPRTGSPLTQELLHDMGMINEAKSIDNTDPATVYMPGNAEHFDVTIYRNVEACGGLAFESVPFGKILRDDGSRKDLMIGHNEKARLQILENWLAGKRGCNCTLQTQREPMFILEKIYESMELSRTKQQARKMQ